MHCHHLCGTFFISRLIRNRILGIVFASKRQTIIPTLVTKYHIFTCPSWWKMAFFERISEKVLDLVILLLYTNFHYATTKITFLLFLTNLYMKTEVYRTVTNLLFHIPNIILFVLHDNYVLLEFRLFKFKM